MFYSISDIIFFRYSNRETTNTKWTLVLPPWSYLPHWKNEFYDKDLPYNWSQFFDVNSLNHYIPVVELRQFIQKYPNDWKMDVVYYLQNYKQTLTNAEFMWIDKADIEPCHSISFYDKVVKFFFSLLICS